MEFVTDTKYSCTMYHYDQSPNSVTEDNVSAYSQFSKEPPAVIPSLVGVLRIILNKLGQPLESFGVTHSADDAAHEYFNGTDRGEVFVMLLVATLSYRPHGGVILAERVRQSQGRPQLFLGRSRGHVNFVSQNQKRDILQN